MLSRRFTFQSPVATKEIEINKPDGSDVYFVDIVAYGKWDQKQ